MTSDVTFSPFNFYRCHCGEAAKKAISLSYHYCLLLLLHFCFANKHRTQCVCVWVYVCIDCFHMGRMQQQFFLYSVLISKCVIFYKITKYWHPRHKLSIKLASQFSFLWTLMERSTMLHTEWKAIRNVEEEPIRNNKLPIWMKSLLQLIHFSW